MTPKEKAQDLFNTFYTIVKGELQYPNKVVDYHAKQCALLCVEEIIKSITYDHESDEDSRKYWTEVKQEIEKL